MATDDNETIDYPCPACGSPLYGWTAAHDPLHKGERIVVDRCEKCGLAVTRATNPPDAAKELEPLIRDLGEGRVALTAPNRRSIQGGLGGAQWAGVEPELRRLHLNPESTRLLLAQRGVEVETVKTPFSSVAAKLMMQTLINAFTLRDNFLRNARAGRLPEPASARDRWLQRLDYVVSYLVAVPCAILAYPLEAVGAVLGRGGILEVGGRRTPQ